MVLVKKLHFVQSQMLQDAQNVMQFMVIKLNQNTSLINLALRYVKKSPIV
jgi:hypothetical protein